MQTAWNSASPTAGPAPQQRGTALVADDEHSNRQILRHLLERHHYRVILAADGARALELFEREHPDIVFIDTRMPVMDGYQVVARLRQQEPGPPVVPIVFLTDLTDRTALRRCIEAGGDDFLTKPFSPVLLEAKLLTMQRLGLLQHRIGRLYSRMKQDEAAAENVFSGAVVAENVAMDQLQTLLRPAEVFSGDVLLSAYSPAGDLNLILGDFTGHGLAAALGALPASEVFRAMTGKGFSPREILGGINRKLHALLPTGMFFAVQFLSIDRSLEKITVCNCGMPDILLLDGHGSRIKHRFASRSLPLSITAELDFQEPLEHYPIEAGDRVLLLSDGVVEARNEHNGYFGRERLEAAILQRRPGEGALDNVVEALDGFCGDAPQDDDISLAEVPCLPDLLPQWADLPATGEGTEEAEVSQQDALTFSLTLSGQRLRETDPVPLLINQILELEPLQPQRPALFTILTELYVNALDHGVLGLDSSLKQGNNGFERYFSERQRRLQSLTRGSISIRVELFSTPRGGEAVITVEDSGNGFDARAFEQAPPSAAGRLSGRGIMLVRNLCRSLHFHPPGNRVEARFQWRHSAPGGA